jgi:hypothetical protein
MRAVAIESPAAYGTSITGFLGDFLADETVAPTIRRQIPRPLKLVTERSRSARPRAYCSGASKSG